MRLILTALLPVYLAHPATCAPCGGDFPTFLTAMVQKALSSGLPDDSVKVFFNGARQAPALMKSDLSQGVFGKKIRESSKSQMPKTSAQNGLAAAQKRAAVQREQMRLRLPADAWPTVELPDAR